VIDYIQRRSFWFSIAAAVLAGFGMIGYVGGRMIADYNLVPFVLASTYVVLAGLALFAGVLFINTPKMSRPLVGWAMGAMFVLFGVLLVAFPYDRAVAVPMAALTVVLIVLIIAFWERLPPYEAAEKQSRSMTMGQSGG
jgi:hypothetical protein